ncbi:MAG: hypothetical protein M3N13_06085, partial [Candidatus Eremiobacteraeota bacterium]|nr:hypothetical protein [Candidatus Eremiobacteraeota bacterium]
MKERGFGFREKNLLSPAQALAAYFGAVAFSAPALEFVSLDDAYGRILGVRIDADRDYPDAPRSAMDGFAVSAASVPARLAIAGEIAMGTAWSGDLPASRALRIATGGVVPGGADAVVPIEDAFVLGNTVEIGAVAPGENINPRGGDMRVGEPALFAGARIRGPQLGVLATLGMTSVPVFRRPVVAIISSGDE